MPVKSTEEDGEGENGKMRRRGERISNEETKRMTLNTQSQNSRGNAGL